MFDLVAEGISVQKKDGFHPPAYMSFTLTEVLTRIGTLVVTVGWVL